MGEGDVPAADQRGLAVAALLAGDVDMIEDPPTADLPKLRRDPKLALAEAVRAASSISRSTSSPSRRPAFPDTDGKNPLKDRRVRQALSQAIDRKAIVDKIMEGVALPAGDFLPSPAFGTLEGHRSPTGSMPPLPARCSPTPATPTASRSL